MFKIAGDTGTYEVKAQDGVMSCSCKSWIFSPGDKPDKDCKHLRAVRDTLGLPTNHSVTGLLSSF